MTAAGGTGQTGEGTLTQGATPQFDHMQGRTAIESEDGAFVVGLQIVLVGEQHDRLGTQMERQLHPGSMPRWSLGCHRLKRLKRPVDGGPFGGMQSRGQRPQQRCGVTLVEHHLKLAITGQTSQPIADLPASEIEITVQRHADAAIKNIDDALDRWADASQSAGVARARACGTGNRREFGSSHRMQQRSAPKPGTEIDRQQLGFGAA